MQGRETAFYHGLLGEITSAEYIRRSGIASCSDLDGHLDSAIVDLWLHCLQPVPRGIEVRVGIKGPTTDPDPRRWHRNFVTMIDLAEEGAILPPLSRHFAEDGALVYPTWETLKWEFIKGLRTPEQTIEDYDAVFARAQGRVRDAWAQLGRALASNDPDQIRIANADLDTGKDSSGQFLFWSATA